MPAYLVRLIDTHDLVGIFFASSVRAAFFVVDECTEVDACEYVVLPSGGIMWTKPAVRIPIELPQDGELDEANLVPWAEASFTEVWWNYAHGFENLKWKLFFSPGPSDPVSAKLPVRRRTGTVLPFRNKGGREDE